ncbi:MAG: DUF1501 domain-containing protein [Longimicrobiales bacterium]
MERRVFVKSGALALLALGMPPEFITRSLLAETRAAARKKTLICIFQRGAVDGLNMVVPFGDKSYFSDRRSIAIQAPARATTGGALDLNGFFGLHPALQPLRDLYTRNEMAIVHAVGSPHPTRSHFDAQDFMETGTPGVKSTRDGWLNRVLAGTPHDCADCTGRTLDNRQAHAADHTSGQLAMASGVSALRGISLGAETPRALRGKYPTLSIPDLDTFGVAGGRDASMENAFTRTYGTEAGTIIGNAADGAFEAMQILKRANLTQYRPASGVEYPAGEFGRSLRQIAQLIKAGVGVEIAFVDIGGWDTHQAQGGDQGQLANRFRELSRGIRALYDDLGDRMDDVVLLTMSEFGRTVRENGTGGTDHGHATCMMVMGGPVAGGKVYGEWPGLAREQLYEGRDLAVTTDFRDLFAEVVQKHLGAKELGKVFPGYVVNPEKFRGVLG